MKTHAIIPIFISHKGCPNTCVFCNQNKITAKNRGALIDDIHSDNQITEEEITKTIEEYLSTLKKSTVKTIEIAFYGGSFTAIPAIEQSQYLAIAKKYKDAGHVNKIHISTRPDYINKEILQNLKHYGVDIIELGVQSFCDDVLVASERGHGVKEVRDASQLIKDFGFDLGLQLMIGLPNDTKDKSIYSAYELVKLSPSIARLYPTIVIKNTKLEKMLRCGEYIPLRLDEAVETTKEMYQIITNAGINVIRIGLKSSDMITEDRDIYGNTFHPAFSQLVKGKIAREVIEKKIQDAYQLYICNDKLPTDSTKVEDCKLETSLYASSKNFSYMIGHNKVNKLYFEKKFPILSIKYHVDNTLTEDFRVNFDTV